MGSGRSELCTQATAASRLQSQLGFCDEQPEVQRGFAEQTRIVAGIGTTPRSLDNVYIW